VAAVTLQLPWPPSVNHYWRRVGRNTLISREGRAYRVAVKHLAGGHRRLCGRLAVDIRATPPDRRRRDLDNLPKAILDSLEHAGLFEDDGQIDRLFIRRDVPEKPGWVTVRVEELAQNNIQTGV